MAGSGTVSGMLGSLALSSAGTLALSGGLATSLAELTLVHYLHNGESFSPSSDTDDIGYEQNTTTWHPLATSGILFLGEADSTTFNFGMRFDLGLGGVTQGVLITEAFLDMAGVMSDGGPFFGDIFGIAVDSPAAFSSSNRPSSAEGSTTTASVTVSTSNQDHIDVTSIIQELVLRPGYSGIIALVGFENASDADSALYVGTYDTTDFQLSVDWLVEERRGTLTATLADLSVVSGSSIISAGGVTETLEALTSFSNSKLLLSAQSATTLDVVLVSGTAVLKAQAELASMLSDTTLEASGLISLSAVFSVPLSNAILIGAGRVTDDPISSFGRLKAPSIVAPKPWKILGLEEIGDYDVKTDFFLRDSTVDGGSFVQQTDAETLSFVPTPGEEDD